MIGIMFSGALPMQAAVMKISTMFFAFLTALWVAFIATAQLVAAQNHRHAPQGASPGISPSTSPYAGMEKRSVKALSDQEIADLKAGRGMGLAMAAELNGYPGPMHVLELAQALQLSDLQRTRTEDLIAQMKAEATAIGERIIAEEMVLDRLFAEKRVTLASLAQMTSRIGGMQAELRSAHLRYHLTMTEILSAEQSAEYAILRGYAPKR